MDETPDPATRRIVIDNLANNVIGLISQHGYGLAPQDYKQLLIELLDRIAGSLDYIGEGKVELVPSNTMEKCVMDSQKLTVDAQ